MREKIEKILNNYRNDDVPIMETMDALISTLIESLPEEKKFESTDENYENDFEYSRADGYNAYRSEVIDLLRGN